ncbi:hybrid sensor histidine kinase/response regulator [Aliishimia ponticola]|nr:PAS domain-containing sensor histidine kinase [Aliishimia ponticola]
MLAILLGANSFRIPEVQVPLDGRPGLLLFAGYLGGPLGAAIAGGLAASSLVVEGGPTVIVFAGICVMLAIAFSGAGLARLLPPTPWPQVHWRAVVGMIVCYIAIHYTVAVLLWYGGAPLVDINRVIRMSPIVIGVGALSVLIVWLTVMQADRAAQHTFDKQRLKINLDLAQTAANYGVFSGALGTDHREFDLKALQLLGLGHLTPGPHKLETVLHRVHPDDVPDLIAADQRLTVGEDVDPDIPFRIIIPETGEIRHLRVMWSIWKEPSPEQHRITALLIDETDRRKRENARLEALERIAQVARSFPGVIFQLVLHAEGGGRHFTFASDNVQEVWGFTPAELMEDSMAFYPNQDPDDVAAVRSAIAQCAATGERGYVRTRAVHTDGSVRWVDLHITPKSLENGETQITGVIVDVTREVDAMREAERQGQLAMQAQKMESIGRLTAGVAHDFNNLLAVIMGNLELLQSEPQMVTIEGANDKIIAGLEATQRGANLTRSMLSFARQARLAPEIVDINDIVRHAKIWMHRAMPSTIDVELSLLAGLWKARLDKTSLENAILNLLLNARDAMDATGRLTIETANVRIDQTYIDQRGEQLEPGRYVMLAVSDTGVGMDADTLAHVFEPFFTTKGAAKGSGIGLSMVEGFVKQSGGTVQVYTEVGAGTTFKLYFPATSAPSAVPSPEVEEDAVNTLARQHILLVEDEPAVRDVLTEVLRSAGYQVTTAETGDRAKELFESTPGIELLVTDIVMPGTLQGTHLARALRDQVPTLPVVFMSGYASEATVHGNGLKPEDIRLMKPVPRDELIRAVVSALHNASRNEDAEPPTA